MTVRTLKAYPQKHLTGVFRRGRRVFRHAVEVRRPDLVCVPFGEHEVAGHLVEGRIARHLFADSSKNYFLQILRVKPGFSMEVLLNLKMREKF